MKNRKHPAPRPAPRRAVLSVGEARSSTSAPFSPSSASSVVGVLVCRRKDGDGLQKAMWSTRSTQQNLLSDSDTNGCRQPWMPQCQRFDLLKNHSFIHSLVPNYHGCPDIIINRLLSLLKCPGLDAKLYDHPTSRARCCARHWGPGEGRCAQPLPSRAPL